MQAKSLFCAHPCPCLYPCPYPPVIPSYNNRNSTRLPRIFCSALWQENNINIHSTQLSHKILTRCLVYSFHEIHTARTQHTWSTRFCNRITALLVQGTSYYDTSHSLRVKVKSPLYHTGCLCIDPLSFLSLLLFYCCCRWSSFCPSPPSFDFDVALYIACAGRLMSSMTSMIPSKNGWDKSLNRQQCSLEKSSRNTTVCRPYAGSRLLSHHSTFMYFVRRIHRHIGSDNAQQDGFPAVVLCLSCGAKRPLEYTLFESSLPLSTGLRWIRRADDKEEQRAWRRTMRICMPIKVLDCIPSNPPSPSFPAAQRCCPPPRRVTRGQGNVHSTALHHSTRRL